MYHGDSSAGAYRMLLDTNGANFFWEETKHDCNSITLFLYRELTGILMIEILWLYNNITTGSVVGGASFLVYILFLAGVLYFYGNITMLKIIVECVVTINRPSVSEGSLSRHHCCTLKLI